MPAAAPLMNVIMRDGTRHFLTLRETLGADEIKERIGSSCGTRICHLTRGGFHWRLRFQCLGWGFSIANPFGEFWFFVEDPGCPDDILDCVGRQIADMLA